MKLTLDERIARAQRRALAYADGPVVRWTHEGSHAPYGWYWGRDARGLPQVRVDVRDDGRITIN